MTPAMQIPSARARLRPEPPVAHIGQSVVWTLSVEHPVGSAAHLGDAFAAADLGWVEESRGTPFTRPLVGEEPMLITTLTWTGRPLEPGDLSPPAGEVSWSGGRGREVMRPQTAVLRVHGELTADEDVPRPPAGLESAIAAHRDTGVVPTLSAVPLAAVLVLALVLLAAFALWRGRRRGRAKDVASMTPRESLASLRAEQDRDPGGPRAAAWLLELSGILRRAVEEMPGREGGVRLGRGPAPGLTDAEWLAWLTDERLLDREHVAQARDLLDSLEATRFSGRKPTRFAVEAMLEQGQLFLDNLGAAAARAGGSAGDGADTGTTEAA